MTTNLLNMADESWEPVVERRRRSTSAGSIDDMSDPPAPDLSRAARRNMERRRRRREARAEAGGAEEGVRPEASEGGVTEAEAEKALRRTEKALRGIRALEERSRSGERLTSEEREKLGRLDGCLAAKAAFGALLLGFELRRQRADAIFDALERVAFDEGFECSCCREVLELPVALPCGHEFCRACVAGVAERAKRPTELACPLCRTNFYDGVKKACVVAVAAATRAKLKKRTGTCHCGTALPLSQLREHLRGCGDARAYFAPRRHLGHELCPPPRFSAAISGAAAAAAAAAPDDAGGLQDALLRRYRVTPRAPRPRDDDDDDAGPPPEATPEAEAPAAAPAPGPRAKRKSKWRPLAGDAPEGAAPPPPVAPPPAEPRRGWGAAPPPAPVVDLRSVMSESSSPRPASSRGARPPAPESPPDSPSALPLSAFLRGAAPTPAKKAPWLAKAASPTSVRDILADEAAAAAARKSTWAGVAK